MFRSFHAPKILISKSNMKKSDSNPYVTINRDYGSFYSGRLQHGKKTAGEVAHELMINDRIRNERRQLPSIAYDIMFDVGKLLYRM